MDCRLVLLALWATAARALVSGPWSDTRLSPEERARRLVENMTLDEKLGMLHGPVNCTTTGAKCAYVGNVAGIERLDTPPITMNDGPQGFRDNSHPGTTTAWPSSLTIAATFDPEAAREWGEGMGREFYGKGSNVQLGPGLCLARVPLNGRNFEYLAGEDPYLGYVLAKSAVEGIQSQKVVANAKHWVLNSQETNRGAVSEDADERTRFELYYPPFEGAIAGGVGSFMCSYNKINGVYSCENPVTLQELKQTLGFNGYMMSDWGATHSPSLVQGLDMEMPNAEWMNPELLKPALATGLIKESSVDEAVMRIFRPMFEVGVMDEPTGTWDWTKLKHNVSSKASHDTACKLSALSTVLMKNEKNLLPLQRDGKLHLAVLGMGGDNAIIHGGGSGEVAPSRVVSPLTGIKAVAGEGANVSFSDGQDLKAAAALAAAADVAVVFVGTLSSEGSDRLSLSLDDGCVTKKGESQCEGNAHQQNALIEAVAKANPKTIVVASVPGVVLMPWIDQVAAVLTNFMPGQEVGHAIAHVLFGLVNPTGKLPLTFPRKMEDAQFSPEQYPGLPDPKNPAYNFYTEKLLVGYRKYDALALDPLFPFGHGLSYTSFAYADLSVKKRVVTLEVENTGKVAGAEVVQLYLSFPQEAGEPPRQLKGFRKTKILAPGEKERVKFKLTSRDFSIWCSVKHAWSPVTGQFAVLVGSSSRDIRLKGVVDTTELKYV